MSEAKAKKSESHQSVSQLPANKFPKGWGESLRKWWKMMRGQIYTNKPDDFWTDLVVHGFAQTWQSAEKKLQEICAEKRMLSYIEKRCLESLLGGFPADLHVPILPMFLSADCDANLRKLEREM